MWSPIQPFQGTGLRGHGVRGLNPTFSRSRPPISKQSPSHVPEDFALNVEKREQDLDSKLNTQPLFVLLK